MWSGEPPRVWNHTLQVPGSAFTRSIGDAVAETVGVYAVPEILVWNLTPDDDYIVIASDGVFEFLSNERVIEMIIASQDNNEGIIDAGKKIVNESYNLWLSNDERTDDISLIIIKINEKRRRRTSMSQVSPRTEAAMAIQKFESKPVRRAMSKAKQKIISEVFTSDDTDYDFEANFTEKTPVELMRIGKMLENNFLFSNIDVDDRDKLFKVIKKVELKAGHEVIKEGDMGDAMYVIDSGEFEVYKLLDEVGENGQKAQRTNKLVFTYTTPGATFGELSLMYGKARAATVIASTDGVLWSINKAAFRSSLVKKRHGVLDHLSEISLFTSQRKTNLQRLSQESVMESFKEDEVVVSSELNNESWVIAVIVHGMVQLYSPGKPQFDTKKRREGSFIVRDELGRDFTSAKASGGKVQIAKILQATFVDIMGQIALSKLVTLSPPTKNRQSISSKGLQKSDLQYSKEDAKHHYTYNEIVSMFGDFGYIAKFTHKTRGAYCLKVVSKKRANECKVEASIVHEREFLASMKGLVDFVPKIVSSFQDEKFVYLAYDSIFVCDLVHALTHNDLTIQCKIFYAACIYQALISLHDFGITHRFLNLVSVYVTDRGCPKLVDLRYCKKMNGSKFHTICGDPLFFAPEIIRSSGYDFGVDIWAYGCLLYEMFDGENPFGNEESDETRLFQTITAHTRDNLKPSDKIPTEAFDLIVGLLHENVKDRLGYKNHSDVKNSPLFKEIDWASLCDDSAGGSGPLITNLDSLQLLDERDIPAYSANIYKDW